MANSGDTEALARGFVAGVAIRTGDGNARAGIAGAAQPAEGVVGRTDSVRAGCAGAGAERRRMAGAVGASCHGAGIGGSAIAIGQALDRCAGSRQAGFTGGAVAVAAAIARHAGHVSRSIGTADRIGAANVLATESGIATDVAGISRGCAIVHAAATAFPTGNTGVVGGAGAATTLIGVAAKVGTGARTETIDRATEVLAVAMPGAAALVAAFGIIGVGWVEMRMATMVAAHLSPAGLVLVGGNVAAPVLVSADPGADGILTTKLSGRIETTALGCLQRFEADRVGVRWGVGGGGRNGHRTARFARFVQRNR